MDSRVLEFQRLQVMLGHLRDEEHERMLAFYGILQMPMMCRCCGRMFTSWVSARPLDRTCVCDGCVGIAEIPSIDRLFRELLISASGKKWEVLPSEKSSETIA